MLDYGRQFWNYLTLQRRVSISFGAWNLTGFFVENGTIQCSVCKPKEQYVFEGQKYKEYSGRRWWTGKAKREQMHERINLLNNVVKYSLTQVYFNILWINRFQLHVSAFFRSHPQANTRVYLLQYRKRRDLVYITILHLWHC